MSIITHPRLLDSVLIRQCDEFRRCYGNILYSWGMLSQRSEVLKFQSHGRDKRQMEIGEGDRLASECVFD